jgi:hypothetical protein
MTRSLAIALLLICVLVQPAQAQTATPIPTNLRAYLSACYMLEESTGTRYDSVGSNDLTDNNTVLRSMGKINQGAKFTAANTEYLSIADNIDYSSNDSWYIAFWVKLNSNGAYQGLFAKWTSAVDGEFYCDVTNTNSITCGVTNNTTAAYNYGPALNMSVNTWYFVIVGYDKWNQRLAISINGAAETLKGLTYTLPDTANAMWIGRWGNYYLDGIMDGFMLWKGRVLTQTERTWLYNDGYGRSCSEVMGHGMTATQTPTSTAIPTATATALPVYVSTLDNGTRIEISRTYTYGDIAISVIVLLAFVFTVITWLARYLGGAGKRTT